MLLIFYFGCAGSLLLCGLFSGLEAWGYSLVVVRGLLAAVASLLQAPGPARVLRSRGSQALEHRLDSCVTRA